MAQLTRSVIGCIRTALGEWPHLGSSRGDTEVPRDQGMGAVGACARGAQAEWLRQFDVSRRSGYRSSSSCWGQARFGSGLKSAEGATYPVTTPDVAGGLGAGPKGSVSATAAGFPEEYLRTAPPVPGAATEDACAHEPCTHDLALEGIKEVLNALLEGHATDAVLHLVARLARELIGAGLASVATPSEGDASMVVRVADGEQAEQIRGVVFPASGSISQEVMRTREPLLVDDVSHDPRVLQPLVSLGNVGPALYVPLASAEQAFGTLSVGNPKGGRLFTNEDLLVVQAFAAQAAVALRYGVVRRDLERLALLEERERIAMDLHDGVIQALFALGLSFQAAELAPHDCQQVGELLSDAVMRIDLTIRDLRNYIFGLKPADAGDRELGRLLRALAEGYRCSGRVSVSVQVDPKAASLLGPASADVLQLAREAMTNSVRHSGGDRISLALRLAGEEAVLEVTDNGRGFDPEAVRGKGDGLANLRVRTETLRGRLEFLTGDGQGAIVRAKVPVRA